MVNIELRLWSMLLYTGNFEPILQGDIAEEDFTTDQGKILHNFVTNYRASTNGAARFPSLSIVRSRFEYTAVELPDPDPADTLEALVHEVKTHRLRTEALSLALELDNIAKSTDDIVEPLIKKQAELRKMTERVQRSRHVSLANGINEVLINYDDGTILPHGIKWPWPLMQKGTRGIHRKQFIVLAGRPKSRKTFTALSIATYAVQHDFQRVLVFTPEMPARQILLRGIAFLCSLRYTEFKDSALNELEILRLTEAARTYGQMSHETDEEYGFRLHSMIPDLPPAALPSIDVVESTGKSIGWMESQIELFRPDLVISDSFYRQHMDGHKNDSDWKALTATSRGLKDLAMNQNIALLGTHQLNRKAEDKVGNLSNMAFADAIGQDTDFGLRVITGKVEGNDVSALVNLGGREVPFDGILINNVPCCDYSEIGLITSSRTVEKLMSQEEEEDAKEETKTRKQALSHKSHKQLAESAQAAKERLEAKNFGIPTKAEAAAEAAAEVEAVQEGEEA